METRAACAYSGPSGRNICRLDPMNTALKGIRRSAPPRAAKNNHSQATRATLLYQSIKEDIILGALPPRERLRIDALRERYQTGASPLREALNRLSAEGFVQQSDQRGFAVTDLNESDLDEIVTTRCALNAIMLPEVVRRGDNAWEERVVLAHYHLSKTPPFTSHGEANLRYLARHREFHMSLLAPCGSRWLLELSEKLFDWTVRYQNIALRSDIVGSRDIAREHAELVTAVLGRDAKEAIRLLNEHVKQTKRLATPQPESYNDA
jgi:GntR family carbon starvation induced transcriptional regulator